MEGRRRTIEVDEDVAVALEKRAAEGAMSVSDMLAADYLAPDIDVSPEDLAELEERAREWERDRLGYDADDVADWLRASVAGRDAPFPKLRKY
ncbi:hypothetical protein [Methylopila turkensis]|uniref:Antitoxin n=1 Tax=Methylopila turkensis TaxID=1437816 RepID=A0A9W6N5J0_9HYPH|nr:hypothetical protein [Methylopila turkensis]GLK78418.1 hypothetical protein GCM10008174_01590 [Methylopila turkensis]